MEDRLVYVAKMFLQHRLSPPTVMGLLLKPTSLPVLIVTGIVAVGALSALGLPLAWLCLIAGVCIGAAARDLGVAIKIVKYWPFQIELMDWHKIEDVASRGDGP